jgi:hypothetical protein
MKDVKLAKYRVLVLLYMPQVKHFLLFTIAPQQVTKFPSDSVMYTGNPSKLKNVWCPIDSDNDLAKA